MRRDRAHHRRQRLGEPIVSGVQIVAGETWVAIACERWPGKVMYFSADEASRHLREFAASLMDRGYSADDLMAYSCVGNGMRHWHVGRQR